jgi:Protein of unknown function (DUF1565)
MSINSSILGLSWIGRDETSTNPSETVPHHAVHVHNVTARCDRVRQQRIQTGFSRFLRIVLLATLLVPWIGNAARTIYVCNTCSNASDGNDGSSARPVRTVTRAHALADPGARDTIQVAAGTYAESLTASKPVIFLASGGSAVIGIAPTPPTLVVNLGPDRETPPGERLLLAGSPAINGVAIAPPFTASWTVDGNPASVVIEQQSGDSAWIRFDVEGTFTVRLGISASGLTGSDDVVVRVTKGSGSTPCSTTLTVSATDSSVTGDCVCSRSPQFLASSSLTGSYGCATDKTTYLWSQVNGPAAANIVSPTQLNTGLNFVAPGCYSFQLTVRSNGVEVVRSSSVQVSVGVKRPSNYLVKTTGTKCPTDGTVVVPVSPTYLSNLHSCASIYYRVKVTWIGGQVPHIQTKELSGTLASNARTLLHCSDADVEILEAKYVSGCGAGDPDGCGPQVALQGVAAPRLMVLRGKDGKQEFVVQAVPGRFHVVEVSTDCQLWTPFTRFVGGDLPYLIDHPTEDSGANQFYRVRLEELSNSNRSNR